MNSWVKPHSYRREWITWLHFQHLENLICQCAIRAVHLQFKKRWSTIVLSITAFQLLRGEISMGCWTFVIPPLYPPPPRSIPTRRTCYFCYGHFDCKGYPRNDITYELCWAQLQVMISHPVVISFVSSPAKSKCSPRGLLLHTMLHTDFWTFLS